MKSIELKPCPFCGGMAVFRTLGYESSRTSAGITFEIMCADCGVQSPDRYKIKFSLNENGEIHTVTDGRKTAAEEWNRRALQGIRLEDAEAMCDHYCKYPERSSVQEYLDEKCAECPLNRWIEKKETK